MKHKKLTITVWTIAVLLTIIVIAAVTCGDESEPEPVTFSERLEQELDPSGVDIKNVEYYESTGQVNVWFVKESAWDTEHLNNSFCYACFDMMGTLTQHPGKIDGVTFNGQTKLIDQQGNESIDKVFFAETTMDVAQEVNWENLENLGTLEPLYNNFEEVWWHQAVRP